MPTTLPHRHICKGWYSNRKRIHRNPLEGKKVSSSPRDFAQCSRESSSPGRVLHMGNALPAGRMDHASLNAPNTHKHTSASLSSLSAKHTATSGVTTDLRLSICTTEFPTCLQWRFYFCCGFYLLLHHLTTKTGASFFAVLVTSTKPLTQLNFRGVCSLFFTQDF